MKQKIAQLAGTALVASMLLSGASAAFAQSTGTVTGGTTYGVTGGGAGAGLTNTNGTSVANTSTNATPGTGSTGTTGTSGASSTTNANGSTTPGIPNTGAGGDTPMNIALLTVSAVVAIGGATYLLRRKTVLG